MCEQFVHSRYMRTYQTEVKCTALGQKSNLLHYKAQISTSARHDLSLSAIAHLLLLLARVSHWNSLPVDVQSAPSFAAFRQKLKTRLFWQSYPDIVFNCFAIVLFEVTVT